MLSEQEISTYTDIGHGDTPAPAQPFVSVIMPVRNEAAFIERSVGAVAAQDYPQDRMEILVADGMSDDATREIVSSLQERHAIVKLIDNPGRIVAAGLNAALRQAKGEIIVRIDGHCEVAPDYLRRCVSHLVQTQVEAVGGPVETIGESLTARAIATAMSSRFGVGGSAFRVANSDTQFTDTVAFPAYKRSVVDLGGPFDEELVRNQDDEYNYRLRKLGVKILLASDIRSRYYSRATMAKLGSQYFQYGYWKVRVMQKHPRQMQLRQFVPPLFVVALLAGLLMMPILPAARYFTGLIVSLYAVAVITASILSARKGKWQLFPLLPIAFVTLHLAYGSGFLFGLMKFWNRWGVGQNRVQSVAPIRDLDKYESI
jgi:succinoglycan biosynthesis protein ExoA